ncbi:MAG: hypothetical protein N4A71_06250 [Carboxylicivirga sp.]|jgi:hypothetical protein|nr:hypothetical protein [Carboxylicivirga sp.]
MKMNRMMQMLASLMVMAVLMMSCSGDDGAIGPAGDKGDKGDKGEQGEIGPAGADGSVIYSGEGLPMDETGATGDYYFDVATGLLYGPKLTDASWADAVSFGLKGEQGNDGEDGNDGKDGSQILTGEGMPGADVGNIGDYYLDIETYTLYGPKSKSLTMKNKMVWGPGLELKGADGNANVQTFKLTVDAEDWSLYQNTITNVYKWAEYECEFPAMTKDIYDNGIVLVYWKIANRQMPLPYVSLTPEQNLQQYTYVLNYNPYDDVYNVEIKRQLEARADKTELLSVGTGEFRIKVISGQAAITLKSLEQNPDQLRMAAKEMGLID